MGKMCFLDFQGVEVIKRYKYKYCWVNHCTCEIKENSGGEWVKHSDYEKLERDSKENQNISRVWADTLGETIEELKADNKKLLSFARECIEVINKFNDDELPYKETAYLLCTHSQLIKDIRSDNNG